METVLTRDAAIAFDGPPWRRRGAALRGPKWLRRSAAAAATVTLALALGAGADRWLRITTFGRIPATPLPRAHLFAEPIRLSITISAAGQRAPWVATDHELRGNVEMWKRLHLADWNGVPGPLRAESLDNMLARYRHVLSDPSSWDAMNAYDWDAVPQPVRTVAYRRMVAYWSGFYDVGAAFDLPPLVVAETLSAIVMSESWFDHRARSVDMAVRAYNRGSGDAADRLGAEYLAAVQRRRAQYIRNLDAPVSWDFIWRQSARLRGTLVLRRGV